MMKNTKRLAFCGIIAALACVVMYLCTVLDLFSLCGTIAAGFLVMLVYLEFGAKTALTVYASVSVISLLILPDKFPAFVFLLFVGYYPIIKSKLEKLKKPLLVTVLKLASFNAALAVILIASRYIATPEVSTPVLHIAVLVLANLVFILSDRLSDRMAILYMVKYRSKIWKNNGK